MIALNYQIRGSVKIWYSIPAAYHQQTQELIAQLYRDESNKCESYITHKECLLTPEILDQNKIPYQITVNIN